MIPQTYILRSWSKFIFFFINLLAIYLFFKGHNEPGGGFIAGIASAISLVFIYITLGKNAVTKIVRTDPVNIAFWGLLLSYLTALAPVVSALPFMFHKILHLHLPLFGDAHVGTPLLFDLGVYLVVIGITAKITFLFDQYNQKGAM